MAAVSIDLDAGTALVRMRAEKLNAFSSALVEDLGGALDTLEERRDLRCVVVAGSGRAFSAGARLDVLRAMPLAEQCSYNERLIEVFDRVARFPVPTIAAVHGYALGGGLELALACTFRISAGDAKLGLPEARLGILPGAGGTQRLPRLIGRGPALRLLLTGRTIDAGEALRIGLVDEIAEDPVAAALALGAEIAGSGPLAVRAINDVVAECADLPVRQAIDRTAAVLTGLLSTRDAAEGMAAFAEKRPPTWTNS